MTHAFDESYWESHWQERNGHGGKYRIGPNPYLQLELAGLQPGTALDAGSGEGAEAAWLATHGWQVSAVDISSEALKRAAANATVAGVAVNWVHADLGDWKPSESFDLVTTFYAHPAMPQLAFYERISEWVAPGGTLLIVGHLYTHDDSHGHNPPVGTQVTAASVSAILDPVDWRIETTVERDRTLLDRSGRVASLRDVVVRATRGTVAESTP